YAERRGLPEGKPRLSARCISSPGRLGDSWQLTAMSHIAEANAGDSELAEGPARASVDRGAVAHPHWGGVAGQLLQAHACCLAVLIGCLGVYKGLLQLGAPLSVALNNDLTLFVLCDLRLLSHDQRSSRKSTCLRTTGSYFFSTMRSGLLRRFLRVTYVNPVPAVDFSLMMGRMSFSLAIRASHHASEGRRRRHRCRARR